MLGFIADFFVTIVTVDVTDPNRSLAERLLAGVVLAGLFLGLAWVYRCLFGG